MSLVHGGYHRHLLGFAEGGEVLINILFRGLPRNRGERTHAGLVTHFPAAAGSSSMSSPASLIGFGLHSASLRQVNSPGRVDYRRRDLAS